MEAVGYMGEYPPSPKLIIPKLWLPGKAIEEYFNDLEDEVVNHFKRLLSSPKEKWDHILQMAGSLGNYSSKKVQDLLWGATAYTAASPYYVGLWTGASVDDTSNGATAGEAAYTSYARLQLTNNTTIFANGTGTTTYTKTWPSDAAKTWATSTGGTAPTVTFAIVLDGNAHTGADNNIAWCSVTSTVINTGDTPQAAQNAFTVTQD